MKDEKNTLNNVTITKDDLLRILKENQEAHNEVFAASTQAYYEALRAEFEAKAKRVKGLAKVISKKIKNVTTYDPTEDLQKYGSYIHNVVTKKPVSYEDDYKSAIRKVELSVETSFTLDNKDFECYVLNNWDWKDSFISTARGYTTGLSINASGAMLSGLSKFSK